MFLGFLYKLFGNISKQLSRVVVQSRLISTGWVWIIRIINLIAYAHMIIDRMIPISAIISIGKSFYSIPIKYVPGNRVYYSSVIISFSILSHSSKLHPWPIFLIHHKLILQLPGDCVYPDSITSLSFLINGGAKPLFHALYTEERKELNAAAPKHPASWWDTWTPFTFINLPFGANPLLDPNGERIPPVFPSGRYLSPLVNVVW